MDFIFNGQASGDVAQTLMNHNGQLGMLRPYIAEDGRSYFNHRQNDGKVVAIRANANASLRKEDWIQLDTAIVRAARQRLKLVNDLNAAGLTYTLDGMTKTVLQTETLGDISGASIDMDALSDSPRDRPEFGIGMLPLPIIHKEFSFSARNLGVGRNSGTPLDTTMAEMCGRQIAEMMENLTIGNLPTNYGGGKVYGLINFPQRLTQVLTNPTASGWTPQVLYSEVSEMKEKAKAARQYGPYRLYVSSGWSSYLDQDWSAAKGDITLRERLLKIEGVDAIVELDFLSGFQMILVEMTSNTIRLVNGLALTTLQWPTKGGLATNFKVMAITVPQVRADHDGRSGIVHGATA